jgi:hypothetical protein
MMRCNASHVRILREMTNNQIQQTMKKELSKTALSVSILVGVLFGALATASAQIIYEEDWGSVKEPLKVNGGNLTVANVGWTYVAPAGTPQPWDGVWGAVPTDFVSNDLLPSNCASITAMKNGQIAMFYTTATAGSGSEGDSSFVSFNPASYNPLIFNVELFGGSDTLSPTNYDVPVYFAVQVGGQWYVSTTLMQANNGKWPVFTNACMNFTASGTNWNLMSITSGVSITAGAVSVPSGNITGVGVVQFGNSIDTAGMDYNKFVIATDCSAGAFAPVAISYPPISQTVYAGGGVSFAVQTSGTLPITNYWYDPNGNLLTDGTRNDGSVVSGSTTQTLTITNVQAGDAGAYSVIVSNTGPNSATNSAFTLTVNTAPSDYMYAETVPFIGPNPSTVNNFLSTTNIGWVSAVPDNPWRVFYQGSGQGAVEAYETTAMTTAFYTTATNDAGESGLPFTNINAADFPQVALEVQIEEGNAVTTDVTAYFAVQMNGKQWYVASSPMGINTVLSGFQTEEMQFTTSVSAWNLLTISTTNAVIGGSASGDTADLSTGIITGAGLVFVHHGAGGALNWYNFLVTDDVVPQAPVIGDAGVPNSQTVLAGGGVSFAVSIASGATPTGYGWTLNGAYLHDGTLADGAVVSGSKTATVTIAGITTNEVGGDGETVNVVAFVTNAFGYDESDSESYYGPSGTTLTVNNPPIGEIYTEVFPFVGPGTGTEPVSSVGWTEAAPSGYVWGLYYITGQNTVGSTFGAVSAWQSSAVTTAYYTTTATDTNQAGLPFPNIVLAGYTNVGAGLILSTEIGENASSAGAVTAYWAVQINGSAWYIDTTPLPAMTAGAAWTFPSLTFNPAAANWQNITISGTGATLGAPAANDLTGVMTGAGLVFVYPPGGGEDDFGGFWITGTGVGDINYGVTGSTLNLSWVGNPYVQLQSATSLANGGNWANVSPGTLGKYSTPVTTTGGPMFYRLVGPVSAE